MRVDKFLKLSRLIKRRAVARQAAQAERVWVNGRVAKPSTEVRAGDRLAVRMGGRWMEVEVLAVPEQVRAEEAGTLYRVISERAAGDDEGV